MISHLIPTHSSLVKACKSRGRKAKVPTLPKKEYNLRSCGTYFTTEEESSARGLTLNPPPKVTQGRKSFLSKAKGQVVLEIKHGKHATVNHVRRTDTIHGKISK